MSGAGLEDTWNLPAVLLGPPATVPASDSIFADRDHRDRSGRATLWESAIAMLPGPHPGSRARAPPPRS